MSGCFRRPTLLVLALVAASLAARPAAAQVSLVPARHPVYEWLRYQRILGNVEGFSYEALPISRDQVTAYLRQAEGHRSELGPEDRTLLDTYLNEFSRQSLEASATNNFLRGKGTFAGRLWRNHTEQVEPHLYAETGDGYAYAIDIWRSRALMLVKDGPEDYRTSFGDLGVRAFAAIGNHVGFHMEAGNAGVSIDKRGLRLDPVYGKTFPVLDQGKSNSFYVEAGATARYGPLSLDLGHGALRYGAGFRNSLILSPDASSSDWIRLRLDTKHIKYTALHGALRSPAERGTILVGGDTLDTRFAPNRWLVMHRFNVIPDDRIDLSFTELVVYSARPTDYAYLNPFNVLFFSELDGEDRDNAMWILEAAVRPIRGIQLYASALIDDLNSISEIWAPDKGKVDVDRAFDFGVDFALPHGVELAGRAVRIEPFVYTHWEQVNNHHQRWWLEGFARRAYPLAESPKRS